VVGIPWAGSGSKKTPLPGHGGFTTSHPIMGEAQLKRAAPTVRSIVRRLSFKGRPLTRDFTMVAALFKWDPHYGDPQ
jgi:hypothetical protein